MTTDELVNVRYMVDDVQAPIGFYTTHLGFTLRRSAAPAFAAVTRGNLRLLLSGPASSARRPIPDGAKPGPRSHRFLHWVLEGLALSGPGAAAYISAGGWNRIHLIVSDIAAEVTRLRQAGLTFRNDIVTGAGGSQILLEDPSGNVIELFQPAGA